MCSNGLLGQWTLKEMYVCMYVWIATIPGQRSDLSACMLHVAAAQMPGCAADRSRRASFRVLRVLVAENAS